MNAAYPSEGVTVTSPVLPLPPAAPAASSIDSVMSSLRSQGSARGLLGDSIDSANYTATQQSVTETMPEPGSGVVAGAAFDAWVVTFNGVTPVSYSGQALPSGMSCKGVAIMSIGTGRWTMFFESCA